VLITILLGIWQWWDNYSSKVGKRSFTDLTHDDLLDILEYDNGLSMEEVLLKYKIYRVSFAAYMEPNILLSLCILITFPYVLNFIVPSTPHRKANQPLPLPSLNSTFRVSTCRSYDWVSILRTTLSPASAFALSLELAQFGCIF
jgi:hypothetical protein